MKGEIKIKSLMSFSYMKGFQHLMYLGWSMITPLIKGVDDMRRALEYHNDDMSKQSIE